MQPNTDYKNTTITIPKIIAQTTIDGGTNTMIAKNHHKNARLESNE
jgi:hypothetical protein